MRYLSLIFLTSLLLNSALAVDSVKENEEKVEAKGIMGGVHDSFLKVIPYVYSDEDSVETLKKDPQKKTELLKNLNDLSVMFQNAKHIQYLQRPGFRPSLETMNAHLEDTINAVTYNNYAFAQKRLTALTSLCISCHSQLSSTGAMNAFGVELNKSKRENFDTDYAFGNYLFLVRDFSGAETYLLAALEKALKESRTHELYNSLRRVMSIHTKISFNYEKAKKYTAEYSVRAGMPILAKEMLVSWDKSLLDWKDFDPKTVTDITKFIQKHLSPLEEMNEVTGSGKNDITLLVASGVLSKFLNDNPKTAKAPEILYWLSVAEKRLSNTYFFTLSDLYLKDCIKLYPKNAYAKKCYKLYETGIEEGYMGSSGLDIPPGEKSELKQLKSYLK